MEMISEHVQRSLFTSASSQQNHSGHLCYKHMDGSPIKTMAAFIHSLQFKPFQERLLQTAKKYTSKLALSICQVLGSHSICVVGTSQAVTPQVGILLPGVNWGEQGPLGTINNVHAHLCWTQVGV